MLISVRTRLIVNRTQFANTIRGYANEFGISAAKGLAHIPMLLERIKVEKTVPELAQELFMSQAEEYAELEKKIADVEAKVKAWQRNDERSIRLNTIPGIGPIGLALLIMKTPAPELFQSGRQFAAWIGLTPKDHSTGAKLASVHVRAQQQAGHMETSDQIKLSRNILQVGGRPHMGYDPKLVLFVKVLRKRDK